MNEKPFHGIHVIHCDYDYDGRVLETEQHNATSVVGFFVSLLYDCHFFLFILFLFRYLIITYFFLIPQIHIPKIEMPKRKYDDKYLDYGFTFLEGRDEQLPQCVICHKTLSNDSMKPHQLKKHLSNVHPEFVGKERQFFELKANYLKKMRLDQGGKFQTESKAIVHASYAVSLLVAKAKKPHSIGETLIKPCLVSCAGILLGESAVSKMKQVSLSNDTVKSRIFDMSCNIKSQLLAKVKASPVFAIQLDESVDVANLSQLIVFVRYVHDQSIEEDLLFCRPLETTTQAADVMQLVDAFFEEKGLDWGKLVHACTDGAPAMLGARSGFAKLLKQKNPKVVTLHCIIHREALASRTMTQPLKEALETAIKLVNFVKASALNTRLFRRLCQDMESDYEGLLFHTAVRWLSKGDMLNRLVHLLPEVTQFLEERNKGDLKAAVSDEAFQCRLAFLADMFSHLNELNRKLQGADSDIIGHRDKVNAFVSKLELWRGKFETGRSATAFPTLARISETAGGVSDVLKNEAIIHLNRLLDEFQHYFPDFKSNNPMMEFTRDPFSFRVDNFPKEAEDIEDQFLDLVHDSASKAVFAEKSLNAFWATMHGSYPRVAVAALTLLVAFPSTYLCESAFSSMVEIKTKSRNRLIDLESDLRCAISKVEPNIEALVKAKLMQKSH